MAARPKVAAARKEAKQEARASGAKPKAVKAAGKAAAKSQVQANRAAKAAPATPAPTPASATPSPGTGYNLEYNQPVADQLDQPWQDLTAAGSMAGMYDVLGNMSGQSDMMDIYGSGAAGNFGGAQRGMDQMAPIGGAYTGQAGNNLAEYQQLSPENMAIQQQLAQQIQDIQAGKADFDPFLTQQLNDQDRLRQEQMRRQGGGDWQNSSAGIESTGKFDQFKNTTLGSAQFQRLQDLIAMQQGGIQNIAGQGLAFGGYGANVQNQQFGQGSTMAGLYANAGNDAYNRAMGLKQGQMADATGNLANKRTTQDLYANVPNTMAGFGNMMGNYARNAVSAQSPYQGDRMAQLQASYSPTGGQMWGDQLSESGDRFIQSAAAMGGGGGGGGGFQSGMQAGMA